MILPIVKYGTPVLRESWKAIETFDEELGQLVTDMVETMHHAEGIGLAAQQIGKALGVCVVDVPPDADVDENQHRLNPDIEMPLILINPEVVGTEGPRLPYTEGCLSFPGINGRVERQEQVTVRYQTLEGDAQELRACGLVGRCIQHEIDHLNGVLFIDHMSPVKKLALKGKLRRLREETEADLG